jgi:hypothetical protein
MLFDSTFPLFDLRIVKVFCIITDIWMINMFFWIISFQMTFFLLYPATTFMALSEYLAWMTLKSRTSITRQAHCLLHSGMTARLIYSCDLEWMFVHVIDWTRFIGCRVIWGWNDTDLYVGKMSNSVDIISVDVNDSGLSARNNACLWSEYMTSVPFQLSAHPYKVGHLACANSWGKVFLWTSA